MSARVRIWWRALRFAPVMVAAAMLEFVLLLFRRSRPADRHHTVEK